MVPRSASSRIPAYGSRWVPVECKQKWYERKREIHDAIGGLVNVRRTDCGPRGKYAPRSLYRALSVRVRRMEVIRSYKIL